MKSFFKQAAKYVPPIAYFSSIGGFFMWSEKNRDKQVECKKISAWPYVGWARTEYKST